AGHSWLDRLDLRKVTLGAGKRLLYKGGRLDTKYGITVPRSEEVPDV
ncbi:MAG: type IV toxin-antitoxin system AbiEi family antitoxin domain-containing protein, partial [Candidatus Bipolaricaulota bacterium]|nr:type IV toxin-antitoxin system AbiEi family antitoxin domain-containing protein [Candidatus Bipolaricaulota bacterium]